MLKKVILLSFPIALSTVGWVSAESKKHDHDNHKVEKVEITKQLDHDDDHKDHDDDHKDHDDDHKDHDDDHKDHDDDHKDHDDDHKDNDDDHKDHDDEDHDDHKVSSREDSHDHEEPAMVKLGQPQLQMAGIKVGVVKNTRDLVQVISAPGEVVNNLYHTTMLSTQTGSKVLSRKAVLGQHVKKDDEIAVLYSVDIATAQNQLKVSLAEWQRVRKLGRKTVGEKRYIEAKAAVDKNKALLAAYGFNQQLIKRFLAGKNSYGPGQYPIKAPHDGVVLEDHFQSGQYLPAGSSIALIVNEDQVWIEALLSPELGQNIPVGTMAKVEIANQTFQAEVIHDSHAIDEVTRTRKIRLQIDNKNHLLHAGLFADVYLQIPVQESVILLPESALMRSADGDWTVFIEQDPGVFQQEEVQLEKTINGLHAVQGLATGSRIAMQGAFFLASELAKGGFDPHNH